MREEIHAAVEEIVSLREQLGIDFKARYERPYGFAEDMFNRGVLDRYISMLKYRLVNKPSQGRMF